MKDPEFHAYLDWRLSVTLKVGDGHVTSLSAAQVTKHATVIRMRAQGACGLLCAHHAAGVVY